MAEVGTFLRTQWEKVVGKSIEEWKHGNKLLAVFGGIAGVAAVIVWFICFISLADLVDTANSNLSFLLVVVDWLNSKQQAFGWELVAYVGVSVIGGYSVARLSPEQVTPQKAPDAFRIGEACGFVWLVKPEKNSIRWMRSLCPQCFTQIELSTHDRRDHVVCNGCGFRIQAAADKTGILRRATRELERQLLTGEWKDSQARVIRRQSDACRAAVRKHSKT